MNKRKWRLAIVFVIVAILLLSYNLFNHSTVIEDEVSKSDKLLKFTTEYRVTRGNQLEIINTLENISGKKLSVQTPYDCFQTYVINENDEKKVFSYAVISEYVYDLAIGEDIIRKVVFDLDGINVNSLKVISYLPYLVNDIPSNSIITNTMVNELELGSDD